MTEGEEESVALVDQFYRRAGKSVTGIPEKPVGHEGGR